MESNRYIVDSSVFVAFYRDVDAQHNQALRIMSELSALTLIVHPYVIQETATVLSYKCGLKVAKQFCLDIASAGNVIIPAVDARYDINHFVEAGEKMSFTDITLIELARAFGARVVTFDRQMLARARS